jgi:hypothetical protein
LTGPQLDRATRAVHDRAVIPETPMSAEEVWTTASVLPRDPRHE